MSQRLVVIDGKSIFYRGYYAMPDLTTSKGMPSGGVYGFTVLALNVIKKLKPDYVCIAWDKAQTNTRSRRKLYPQYKAQRHSAPESFYAQIPVLFDLLQAFNWPLYELDDYEADDIMATLAKKARARKLETILVSSDLDMLQALGDYTKMFIVKKGMKHIEEFDAAEFRHKYGLDVAQFCDLKALMGDSSDNVPGVAGIGKKRATQLLVEYKTLENIYQHLDDIPDNLAQKLRVDQSMAFLSRQLVTLMVDAPVRLDLKAMSIANLDPVKLQQALHQLEFYSLIPQIPPKMQLGNQAAFVPQTNLKLKKSKAVEHQALADLKELDWQKPIFLHAYCKQRFGKKLLHLLASDEAGVVHVYPSLGEAINLNLKQATIYGYDTKVLVQVLSDLGVGKAQITHDLKVVAFLLNSNQRLQSLSTLAMDSLGYLSELDDLTPAEFCLKASEIHAIMEELRAKQTAELSAFKKLQVLLLKIEYPFIPVLARLERTGMAVDRQALIKLGQDVDQKLEALETTIYDLAGQTFNLASPSQLAKILYDKLQLPTTGIRKNKTGYSTDAESLARFKKQYPIVFYLLEWRELAKLKNTYVGGLLEHLEPDGRVYSDMRLTTVATGRLSSARPNLQNIPVKTEIGSLVRQAFMAPAGYQIISADYSQFELRLAAVLAKDQTLIEAFNEGLDIHKLTASIVFEVPLEAVTKPQRYLAKTINFGVLYGQGPHSLANQTSMSYTQAKDFIDKYFQTRPKLRQYQADIRHFAQQRGYVETLFGRRRLLPDINNSHHQLQEAAWRQAINMPIQGTEADLMKLAMIALDRKLPSQCRQIMQVHDSILVECPISKAQTCASLLRQVMEDVYPKLGIKLQVEVAIDNHWPI